MSASVRYRARMVCGEPLQSRWWVAVMVPPAVSSASERPGANSPQCSAPGSHRQGVDHDGG